MTEDQIKELILRGIRDPGGRRVDPDQMDLVLSESYNFLGLRMVAANPEYFAERKSIASETHIFSIPSDNHKLLRIWDLETNAATISGAADNGSGLIKITTDAVHGFSDDEVITIHDVAGTIEANDTWKITVVDTTNFTLNGSAFTNAWTSGGKAFKEDDFDEILRTSLTDPNTDDNSHWFMRKDYIVVDDLDFTYDIVVDYTKIPTALTDFPAKLHFAIVGWGVLELIEIPPKDEANHDDFMVSYRHHLEMWNRGKYEINNFDPSAESRNLSDVSRIKRWI